MLDPAGDKTKKLSNVNLHWLLLTVMFFALLVQSATLLAGTTGKLAGRVLDKNKAPIIGANVVLVGTTLGASTDLEGYYSVINIPPGTYQVRFSCVGYQTTIVKDVIISVNKTTTLDAELTETAVVAEAVVVTATRPVVEVNLTSSVAALSDKDISVLPVQELQDIVNLQAGVINGHFRGGRLGEVQYQIDGVSVNNPYDNSSSIRLDRSLLQEVQVISGTFDAEYGQAMSGVVNVVLKSGSEKFEWNAEAYTGDYVFPGNTKRIEEYTFKPTAIQNYQLTLSGPAPLPQTSLLLSGRRYVNEGYLYGVRRFLPTDSSNFEKKIFNPTGDNEKIAMSPFEEWSGLIKLTNRCLHSIEVSYQALVNTVAQKRYDFAFRLNPDGMREQRSFSLVHGIDWTHTLSSTTFYKLSLRQNYFDYHDYVYEDVYDPRYLDAGAPIGDVNYELGAVVQGVDLGRFKQRTNSFVLKGSITSQATRSHLLKVGAELELSRVEFGVPGWLVPTNVGGVQLLRPRVNEPPDYPDISIYHPISISAYAQDQIEWNDLVLRGGVRMQYFDARSTVPGDLQNPANAIAGAPKSVPRSTSKKVSFAPRLGVSYPITTQAAVFFAYGHFYQLPGLGQLFSNSDYSVLKELQAGGISYGVLGNPDLKPERTVQYEFGYKHALTDFLGLDVNLFYKDIRDLLGVEFVSTYAAAEYARLTNIDFGQVLGFTIAIDQRRIGLLSTSIDYTYQLAQGNSSDPRETATRASAGEDPRPRQVPLNWDQRHTLNATISLQQPNDFTITTIIRYGSGQPYTPTVGSGFGAGLETNSGRKPNFVLVDLRAEKFFQLAGVNMSVFARIFNLFDARFANGFIFTDTGSPDYSLNPVGDRAVLNDPGRFYPPRRIEVGISLNGSAQ